MEWNIWCGIFFSARQTRRVNRFITKPELNQLQIIINPTMADTCALDVCHQLLYQLRLSNLHFALSETPHSVKIMMRKRFLKDFSGPASIFGLNSSSQEFDNLKHENNHLVTENYRLNEQIEELKVQLNSSNNTLDILETKIEKVEAAALKSYEERKLEINTLKDALKNRNIEIETCKRDLNARNKTLREKEKETTKLDKKAENLGETVKKLKVEISSYKQEIKKMENQHKTKTKKFQSMSTNTVPYSSALFSGTTPKCHLKNNSTTKEIYSSTRNPAFSYKLIPLGPVLDKPGISVFNLTTSMVAHWTPLVDDSFQNPSSLYSMVTHCAKLPAPGDKYLSSEEVLIEMKKWIEDYWRKY